MNKDINNTKHIGEQKPLSQDSGSDNSNQVTDNNDQFKNPIKPQETQKDLNKS